jgi:hypothetical protein
VLRIVLGIGFLIALAATGLVVFADDVRMLRLAAVLALWAALIAAFAVTRSRRDARAAAMREGEAQLAYQLELHREVAARREYEADLTRQVASAQSDQLAELRGQLEQLTSVLSSLVDGELTVSRLTLSAESARFRSLSAPDRTQAAIRGGRYPAVTIEAGHADSSRAEPTVGSTLPADAVEPAEVQQPGQPPAGEIERSPAPRPDAPAASWARRHRTTAQQAGPAGPARPADQAGAADQADAADQAGAADQADAAGQTGPAEPAGADADVPEPTADVLEPTADVPDTTAALDEDDRAGDHESGVPLAELLAAYGLSGRSRRRRPE